MAYTRPVLIDTGLLLIRLVLAAVFIFHGAQKLFAVWGGDGLRAFAGNLEGMGVPLPMVAAVMVGCVEFFCGLVLIVGTGARVAAALLAINMTVAIILVHSNAFSVQEGGMEFALTLGVVSLAIVIMGPGGFTAGRFIRRAQGQGRS
jgi:putative oxidoreductase